MNPRAYALHLAGREAADALRHQVEAAEYSDEPHLDHFACLCWVNAVRWLLRATELPGRP